MSEVTRQPRQLAERYAMLFAIFMGQALFIGVFIAPSHLQDVGFLVGCGVGLPVAAALSGVFMFRPITGTIFTSALTTLVLMFAATEFEALSNPIVILVVYCCVMGFLGVHLFLRPDKPLDRCCPRCDYSLRGLPPGGGCPECGWNRAPNDARR